MTILLVEDDDRVIRAVQRLARILGHELFWARSSREALDRVEQGGIDVVLADLDLGSESGLDVLDRIRGQFPEVKRVLISGSDPPPDFADDPPRQLFLAKPFGRAEFESLCDAVGG